VQYWSIVFGAAVWLYWTTAAAYLLSYCNGAAVTNHFTATEHEYTGMVHRSIQYTAVPVYFSIACCGETYTASSNLYYY
jgi:hypothetical protein